MVFKILKGIGTIQSVARMSGLGSELEGRVEGTGVPVAPGASGYQLGSFELENRVPVLGWFRVHSCGFGVLDGAGH